MFTKCFTLGLLVFVKERTKDQPRIFADKRGSEEVKLVHFLPFLIRDYPRKSAANFRLILNLCCGFALPVSCETLPALRAARAGCWQEWQWKTERH